MSDIEAASRNLAVALHARDVRRYDAAAWADIDHWTQEDYLKDARQLIDDCPALVSSYSGPASEDATVTEPAEVLRRWYDQMLNTCGLEHRDRVHEDYHRLDAALSEREAAAYALVADAIARSGFQTLNAAKLEHWLRGRDFPSVEVTQPRQFGQSPWRSQ